MIETGKLFTIIVVMLCSASVFAGNEILAGKWEGKIIHDTKEWKLEFNFFESTGGLTGFFNLPEYSLYNLEASAISLKEGIFRCEYSGKNSKAVFEGKLEGNNITGKWGGLDLKAEFYLNKSGTEPDLFETKEVTFQNKDAVLAGTLIIPKGKGPFPGVVLIHTSGNQTRSEEFYRSRGFFFAANGIAALIYDRRGRGASTGSEVSMELLADDAIAGVGFLRTIASVDGKKVGVMGNSQGGYVAPLAVSRSKDIAFLITVSAPSIDPNQQNDFTVKNDLQLLKVPEDSIDLVMKLRNDIRDFQYNQIGDEAELLGRLNQIRSRAWFKFTLLDDSVQNLSSEAKDFLNYDPIPSWQKVHIPVLAVWGDSDRRVPAEQSKKEITVALELAGNKNYTCVVFPNSSHGLVILKKGNEFDWPRLADGYQEMLVSWVNKVTE
jgi:dipeptidyl aminopeptidase/acylaminoacyl peptidase